MVIKGVIGEHKNMKNNQGIKILVYNPTSFHSFPKMNSKKNEIIPNPQNNKAPEINNPLIVFKTKVFKSPRSLTI